MNAFLDQKINAVFPSGYLESVESLISVFGEYAKDGNETAKTIYQRQDTVDLNSRRAAGPENETPITLNDGRLLVVDVYPSTGIYAAVTLGVLSGVQIIPANDLGAFLEEYGSA